MKNLQSTKYLTIIALMAITTWLSSCGSNDDAKPVTVPTVKTDAATNVTATTATAGGTITDNGNADITEAGVAYSTVNATPSVSDEKMTSTVKTGTFTTSLTALVSGQKYYLRAYATNSAGTGYGEVITLNTSNLAPTASAVTITGVKAVGSELTGAYTYDDAEGDAESGTTFQWYRANDASGAGEAAITGATAKKYTLVVDDLGKFIRFGVVPKSSTGTTNGVEVKSAFTTAIEATPNNAPVATITAVNGTLNVDENVTVTYTYSDTEGDLEDVTTFKWYVADDATGTGEAVIEGANAATFRLTGAQQGKYVRAGVTPKAKTGTTDGVEVKSDYKGPIGAEITTVTFMYNSNSVTYGIIKSDVTGKKWLDRNLGAQQAATSRTDYLAYGDLFQWGRRADGHQLITRTASSGAGFDDTSFAVNGTTGTLSSTDTPGDALFILPTQAPVDWRSPQNDNLWQGVNGVNNVCPSGWRLPTIDEASAEEINVEANRTQLKMAAGGFRTFDGGGVKTVGGMGTGSYITLWTSSVNSSNPNYLSSYSVTYNVNADFYTTDETQRAYGYSVRCIKD